MSEVSPSSHKILTFERLDFYETMIEELSLLHDKNDLPSSNTFYQVWTDQFPHLKIPDVSPLGILLFSSDLLF